IEFAIGIPAETVHGLTRRQNLRAKLRQRKHMHLAGLKVGVKETAVDAHGGRNQGQVAEDIFAVEIRHRRAAINETAGDGNAVIRVVFEYSHRAGERVNETGGNARAEMSRWRADGAGGPGGTIGSVEEKIPFFDGPAVVAAKHDAVDFLDVVLADVGLNQVAG